MERDLTEDLTKQYASLFEKKGVKKIFRLVMDIYRSGKLREIISFSVWEMAHRLRIFPKKNYLHFSNQDCIVLGKATLPGEDLNQTVVNFFASRDLLALRCEHNWKILFIHSSGDLFGCLYPNDCDLYRSIDDGKSVSFVHNFPEQIKSIYISSHNSLLVCVKGAIYHSADDGSAFKSAGLGSPISFIRYNNAITETPDGILIWESMAISMIKWLANWLSSIRA
jgi:hypothetical protein